MSVRTVQGSVWGDEGKGKVVDLLARGAHATVRFQGGSNAGHTIWFSGKKYALHMLSAGCLHKDCMSIVTPYVLIDLPKLAEEIDIAMAHGSRVFLDPGCPVVLDVHRQIDKGRELRKENPIGTTGRGIGPCHSDRVARRGLTLGDVFAGRERIREVLEEGHYYEALCEEADFLGMSCPSIDEAVVTCMQYRLQILDHKTNFLTDTLSMVRLLMRSNRVPSMAKHIVFEGAHGAGLDIFHGAGQYKTSSMCLAAPCIEATIGPMPANSENIGVVKAYCTRVGEGPFPTELHGEFADDLRERGGEYGTTTGRPRRVGWLDLRFISFMAYLSKMTHVFITKLDVLSGIETLRVCTGYKIKGRESTLAPEASLTLHRLETIEPIYVDLPGWSEDITGCRSFDELPENAQNYVRFIRDEMNRFGNGYLLDIKVMGLGVGKDREESILLEDGEI